MKVFLDTDLNFPSDDFQALMLLLAAHEVQVVGCGAAAGNTWAEEVFANLGLVAALLGEGGLKRWVGEPHDRFAPRRERALEAKCRGLRNFIGAYEKSPAPRQWVIGDDDDRSAGLAAEAIVALAREHAGALDLICIGPLTNLSRALDLDPQLPERLRTVIVMGGYFGDSTAIESKVDFNVWFDPEAAHRVLNAGLALRIVPLDVCRRARVTPKLLEAVARFKRGRAWLFVDDFLGMVRQHGPTMPLADQLVVLLYCESALILTEVRGWVAVDCSDGDTRGQSVMMPDPTGTITVVRAVDVDGAHALLVSLVERMGDQHAEAFGAFESPTYRYVLSMRLAETPVTVQRVVYHTNYQLTGCFDIQSTAEFVDIMRPLAGLLIKAKERSELWPPAPRADALIAEAGGAGPLQFDQLALKELEHLICSRFLNVRAIATICSPDGRALGFACISELTPARRQQLMLQFGLNLPAEGLLAEYSYIERRSCGIYASEYLGSSLLLWYCAQRSNGEQIPVFAVSLASQEASIHKLRIMGYQPIADHIIPDGPEAGRRLILYSLTLDGASLDRLRCLYHESALRADDGQSERPDARQLNL